MRLARTTSDWQMFEFGVGTEHTAFDSPQRAALQTNVCQRFPESLKGFLRQRLQPTRGDAELPQPSEGSEILPNKLRPRPSVHRQVLQVLQRTQTGDPIPSPLVTVQVETAQLGEGREEFRGQRLRVHLQVVVGEVQLLQPAQPSEAVLLQLLQTVVGHVQPQQRLQRHERRLAHRRQLVVAEVQLPQGFQALERILGDGLDLVPRQVQAVKLGQSLEGAGR